MKTIVALVDFTDTSSPVLEHAQKFASAFGSRLILLHVVPPEPTVATLGAEAPAMPVPPTQEMVHVDKARLEQLLASLTSQGVETSALQFEGPVADTVVRETERLHADLVIMGSHHHGALYNLFVGSVTADIMKNATFPVLVLPSKLPAEEKVKQEPPVSAEEVSQSPAVMQPVLSA